MGGVWKAHDARLDRMVAVKMLLRGALGPLSPRALEALGRLDEARVAYETGRRLSGGIAGPSKASGLILLRVHPRLDPIRSDARYWPLVRRVGLDDGTIPDR
jgi:hypothetical protein